MLSPIIVSALTAIVLPYLLYKLFFAGPKVDISHFPIINPSSKGSWFSKSQNDRFAAEATKLVKEGQKKVGFVPTCPRKFPADGSDSMVASPSAFPQIKERKS
jgi:hypothetical protein